MNEIYDAWSLARHNALRDGPKELQMRLLIHPQTYRELRAEKEFAEHALHFHRPKHPPQLFDMRIIETDEIGEGWEIAIVARSNLTR